MIYKDKMRLTLRPLIPVVPNEAVDQQTWHLVFVLCHHFYRQLQQILITRCMNHIATFEVRVIPQLN